MAIKERNNTRKPMRENAPIRRRPAEGEVIVVDVQDPEFLRKFVTEHGKILPQRLTGLNAKQQRKLKLGVRRARTMGTML